LLRLLNFPQDQPARKEARPRAHKCRLQRRRTWVAFPHAFRGPACSSHATSSVRFGNNAADLFGRAATYVDLILKGANPADLPVQLPTKFELIVNLKTAKTLGLTISESFLTRADEVIE